MKAADDLAARGLFCTVADARFAKPIDEELIRQLALSHDVLITVEENAVGGFSSLVLQFLASNGLLDTGLKVRPMVLPDRFLEQDAPMKQYDQAQLNAPHIVALALDALGQAANPARA